MSWHLPIVPTTEIATDGWLRGAVKVHAYYSPTSGLKGLPDTAGSAKQLKEPQFQKGMISWLELAIMLGAALGLCRRRRSPRLFQRKHFA
jgi:hypothetical protein